MNVVLIQALIPIGLKAVEEKLQEEVLSLAGKKHQHGKEQVRWGEQGGSVYLRDQKIPIMVPSVRNKTANRNRTRFAKNQRISIFKPVEDKNARRNKTSSERTRRRKFYKRRSYGGDT